MKRIETCGWCKYLLLHKHNKVFPGGWWVGDGRCKINNELRVMGDTCEKFKKKGDKK